MTPAAPTRSDVDINATELAAPPQPEATPGDPPRPVDPQHPDASGPGAAIHPASADVAAIFDELAPVHDRMATILSLGLDRRWRSAVVEESWLSPGDSAIDVAAGTGRLAPELADRVGPFGRVVAVDLSSEMVDRGMAR